jgi:hypothetical protein
VSSPGIRREETPRFLRREANLNLLTGFRSRPRLSARTGLVPRAETEVFIKGFNHEEIDYADFCN